MYAAFVIEIEWNGWGLSPSPRSSTSSESSRSSSESESSAVAAPLPASCSVARIDADLVPSANPDAKRVAKYGELDLRSSVLAQRCRRVRGEKRWTLLGKGQGARWDSVGQKC